MTLVKRLTLFLLLSGLFAAPAAAQNTYETLWKSVEKLEDEGRTKDALAAVETILGKSSKEKNAVQSVKALLYKYRYRMTLEENSELSIVQDLKQEIAAREGTDKAVLQSILAELYWQYFQQNTWKFSGRTETTEKQSDDFRTWDLKTLFKAINQYYLASLQDAALLQRTGIDEIGPLLSEAKGSKKFRPTLYDLLAHRAIDYFNSDKSNLAEPENAFAISDPQYFAPAAEFVKIRIPAQDTLSGIYQALRIYQQLLDFHLQQNKHLEELADADLLRMQFIRDHYADKSQQEDLYFKALQTMQKSYSSCNTAAAIRYEIAVFIVNRNRTQPGSPELDYRIADAIRICDETIRLYPGTEGAVNCGVLLGDIRNKELSLSMEETLVPGAPFKALVNFRNISELYFKIVPVSYEDRQRIFTLKNKETDKDILKRLNAIRSLRMWKQALPPANDYLSHSVEIKADALKSGCYVLMASTTPSFSIDAGAQAVGVLSFFASSISYAVNNNGNSNTFRMYVLDRSSGQPLQNAKVSFFRNEYDYQLRKYVRKNLGEALSDSNGYVFRNMEKTPGQYYYAQNFQFDIRYKEDFLPGDHAYYQYYYPQVQNEKSEEQVHLFSDRSIYRPGQTIYFKGIVTVRDGEDYKLKTKEKLNVSFKDVNGQVIASADFTTNDYGSFTGTFTAPNTGLMGAMTLYTDRGSASVQVEEYKRPKFEVQFEPVKKAYNLNDHVIVTGKAAAYSGMPLDQAEVRYTIRRVAEIPAWAWWSWRRPWFPSSPEKIIGSGKAMTDSKGNFSITFDAVPDLSVDKSLRPYFTYEVNADVIDLNGETHSATTSVRVGYLAIQAGLRMPDKPESGQEIKLEVAISNLNDQPEATDVTLKIYSVEEPSDPKKARLWNKPDLFLMTKQQHDAIFPYEVYEEEDQPDKWKNKALLKTYSFNSGKQSAVVLAPNTLSSGVYRAELSCRDKNGNEIVLPKTFYVMSATMQTPEPASFIWLDADKASVRPGDTLHLQVGSSVRNAYAILEIAFRGSLIEKKIVNLNREIKTFSIPVSEKYRGGVEIAYALVNQNRLYSGRRFIEVPYEDKSLKIEWQTFRDKLLPGQKEQWKLKISGASKEKMASELLATMYDASLDAFLPHSWSFALAHSVYIGFLGTYGSDVFGIRNSELYTSANWNPYLSYAFHTYDELNLFGLNIGGYYRPRIMYDMVMAPAMRSKAEMLESKAAGAAMASEKSEEMKAAPPPAPGVPAADSAMAAPKPKPEISPRINLNETAFFFPQLQTDEEGNLILSFQMPEALTKWNFLGLAHTKDLHYQYFTKSVVTQKELMVTPNPPRFLREGDTMEFSAKISNMSDKDLLGRADLVIYDAATMKDITWKVMDPLAGVVTTIGDREFSLAKGSSTSLSWTLHIPEGIDAITYKVVAQADNFSDGEQASLPVLPNRMMVTETLPLWVNGGDKKSYTFRKLLDSKASSTLKNYRLTLEMSSQPVWYAVQALPYLMEYPYECSEQLFSRYYANTLASYIANQNPKFREIFDKWKNTDALLSNLEKNQELKSVLLEETPWVREAQSESEQKKRIALLFDLTKMSEEQQKALDKLLQLQTPNGGFTWFPGMPDNPYMTQHIVAGFGHLAKLGVLDIDKDARVKAMLQKAIAYLDDRLREDYELIQKYDKDFKSNNHLGYLPIHALYARSFFTQDIAPQNKEAYDYFLSQEKQYWLNQGLYAKGMIALTLQRYGEKESAAKVLESLRQNAINSEELGMYWKANEQGGYYWYEAPVETQSLLIEAFTEVGKDSRAVDAMKVWLLKQKQTSAWKTTKATAEACYALLLQGKDWTRSDQLVEVTMAGKKVDPQAMGATIEPGTGYYKVSWTGGQIKPEMGDVVLKKKDKGPAWGALYWQYFEDLDKISGAVTNLQLSKKLFREIHTGEGDKLEPITAETPLRVGDVVKVRIELRTDRNMEYVHMKDMRAAGFEPLNVLSQYKYQDGLGYYESTRDVATHFFMDWLPKGVYVFEYDLRATIAGNFSNGITLIENLYAPEFSAHSGGERVAIRQQ